MLPKNCILLTGWTHLAICLSVTSEKSHESKDREEKTALSTNKLQLTSVIHLLLHLLFHHTNDIFICVNIPYLPGHTGICCTLSLSKTTVSPFPSGLSVLADTCSGVHSNRFLDNKAIFNQLPNVLS